MAKLDKPSQTERIPLMEEELEVGREKVSAGEVQVDKHVREETREVDEPLVAERVEVKHVPVGRDVDGPGPVRQEGDTLIVPVYAERMVVRKQLVLVEEVHITRRRETEHRPESVTLRREEVEVRRLQPD